MSSKPRSEPGFTLIEVMIVLVILTFISMGIYQMTTETFRLRDELANEGEFYNGIRMSMDILQRDVAAMFSPIMSRPQPSPSPAMATNQPPAPPSQAMVNIINSDQGKTSSFWLGATDLTGLRASRFVGTDSKLTFISASHIRIYKDTPESDFAKITYERVKDDQNPDSMALLKIENPDAFDDDDRRAEKYEHRYVLLHGIKKFKFRYWRKDIDNGIGRWDASWDSDKDDYREKYPDIVEVSLEVDGPMSLSFTGVYKFRPEVPLHGLDPST